MFQEKQQVKTHIIFEVFTTVTSKDVFWDVTPHGSCKNQPTKVLTRVTWHHIPEDGIHVKTQFSN
jgi:hypothetical protein